MTNKAEQGSELKTSLGPFMLWGLGVGYVISGMYFGWNLGLPKGGTLGLAIATFFIIIMYTHIFKRILKETTSLNMHPSAFMW